MSAITLFEIVRNTCLNVPRKYLSAINTDTAEIMNEGMSRVSYVIGPNGEALTHADLPTRETKRWVIRRKAEVVAAVRGGLITLDEACRRYTLTAEEFHSWQRAIDRFGLAGLRVTRVQQYRG